MEHKSFIAFYKFSVTDKQLTTKYVMTFAIQYVIAVILTYDVYYEVLILSP